MYAANTSLEIIKLIEAFILFVY